VNFTVSMKDQMPLHVPAGRGDHEAVAQLLADPSLVIDDAAFANALHYAASGGHATVIAQLLAANPACIDAVSYYDSDKTALHIAAFEGHANVIAQLLAANPACIDAVDKFGMTALHIAAEKGHATVIAQLLAAKPACVDAVDDEYGRTALHMAVSEARHAVTKQLLAAKPELIKVLDNDRNTAFAEAVGSPGHLEEELLALGITPEEVNIYGFGSILRGECCHEIVTFLYNLYPEAATLEVDISDSPFLNALVYKNDFAIELLQWKLSFDDIVAACTHEVHDRDDLPNYVERYQPIMETQCEALFPLLGDDVMGIVFECLGLEARNKKSAKRQRV